MSCELRGIEGTRKSIYINYVRTKTYNNTILFMLKTVLENVMIFKETSTSYVEGVDGDDGGPIHCS